MEKFMLPFIAASSFLNAVLLLITIYIFGIISLNRAKEMAFMEKKPRLIFHCDCNNFFASCEILERPELKDVPMAVAGDPENRLGVVVAKNELAKKCGVKPPIPCGRRKRNAPASCLFRQGIIITNKYPIRSTPSIITIRILWNPRPSTNPISI